MPPTPRSPSVWCCSRSAFSPSARRRHGDDRAISPLASSVERPRLARPRGRLRDHRRCGAARAPPSHRARGDVTVMTEPFHRSPRPARAERDSAMPLLDGLRVIDAASFIAGPVATTILADLGADVIKVEPPDGDPYRHRTGGPGVPDSPYNYRWIVDNRTKRGLALDLRRAEGRAVLHRLVQRADVFVTNTPLDSRQRLGIRWEDLAPLNARLIYASITAYGERGEEAPRSGFDSTALWARTGLMDLVRPSPDSPPSRSLPGMGDHPTGVSLFAAIMSALYRREKTGTRTMVSTSLMANGLWWDAIQVPAALSGAHVGRVAGDPQRVRPHLRWRGRDRRRPHGSSDGGQRRAGGVRRSAGRGPPDRRQPALAGRRRQGAAPPASRARRALGRGLARGGLRRGGDQTPGGLTRGGAVLGGVDLKRLTVDAAAAGARLDRWLAERVPAPA